MQRDTRCRWSEIPRGSKGKGKVAKAIDKVRFGGAHCAVRPRLFDPCNAPSTGTRHSAFSCPLDASRAGPLHVQDVFARGQRHSCAQEPPLTKFPCETKPKQNVNKSPACSCCAPAARNASQPTPLHNRARAERGMQRRSSLFSSSCARSRCSHAASVRVLTPLRSFVCNWQHETGERIIGCLRSKSKSKSLPNFSFERLLLLLLRVALALGLLRKHPKKPPITFSQCHDKRNHKSVMAPCRETPYDRDSLRNR